MKDHEIRELVNQLRDIAIKYHGTGQLRERIAHVVRAAILQAGNSPVIPDGYVMVPMRLTAENGAKAALLGEFNLEYSLTCHECFGEGCDDCRGEGTWTNTIPIDWTTIKEIWAKGVEHFAAAPHDTPALNSVQSVDTVADRWIP
ncbi:hypothetical protein ACTZNP_28045, partial [Klebsiella pneumoniae]